MNEAASGLDRSMILIGHCLEILVVVAGVQLANLVRTADAEADARYLWQLLRSLTPVGWILQFSFVHRWDYLHWARADLRPIVRCLV